jgi:hypothetical protein
MNLERLIGIEMEKIMGSCSCGFTTDPEKNCNGTHKIVRAVREKIASDIEASVSDKMPPSSDEEFNIVDAVIKAADIARGKNA